MSYVYLTIFAITCTFYYSLIEWLLHRFVMHKNLKWFSYPFTAHTLVHHDKFKANHTYHGQHHPEDMHKIPMAWWNGIVMVTLSSLPAAILSIVSQSWSFILISFAVGGLYYGAYEYIHWCMHLPKKRRLEMLWVFKWLNAHHLLHHRYMKRNFNVVLPFWDWIFGTLKTVADTPFAQPKGPYILDVQP
jgi:hypothetical protein